MDQHRPFNAARPQRRRLLAHAAVFAVAGVACLALTSPSGAAPTVQEGRFLQGGSIKAVYSCTGNDQTTNDLLTGFQLNPFSLPVTITSTAVEPAPSPGEDFDVAFTWDYTLPQNIVDFALGLGVEGFEVSNGVNKISATAGATGTSTGAGKVHPITLGDGTVPVGFTEGPFTATFNRTAEVDEPITFKPQQVTNTTTSKPSNIPLQLKCTPGATVLTVMDETGVAPSTTTTTRPGIVTTTSAPAPVTTAAVAGTNELPRTGSSSNLFLALLALALIDVGYLALSASRDRRVPSAS